MLSGLNCRHSNFFQKLDEQKFCLQVHFFVLEYFFDKVRGRIDLQHILSDSFMFFAFLRSLNATEQFTSGREVSLLLDVLIDDL